MTGTARIPKAELTGIQGGLLKLAIRKKIGDVPENVEVMWNHPAVFKDLMRMGAKTEKWDRLDHNLASFAVMAAAAEIGCSFVPGPELLHGPRQGFGRGQGARGAAVAGVRDLHPAGAPGDGVRRGDVPDAARRSPTRCRRHCSRTSVPTD